MADTPEKKVKKEVEKILKEFGVYYFFPTTGGYGRSGIHDVIGCYKGRFIAIECKAGNNVLTALQRREDGRVQDAGGVSVVITEVTLNLLRGYLKLIAEEQK